MNIRKTKVLVTGGAGYVGGYLTDLLRSSGYDVTVYDNLLYESRFLKNVTFIRGDIRDTDKLGAIINNYDVVVWLAAMVGDGACQVDTSLTTALNFTSVKWLVDNYKGKICFPSTCHDTKTKLLTKRGVIGYDEISMDDEVLSVNVSKNKLEWKGISRIIVKDYDGKLEVFNGRRASFALTPEHKLLLDEDGVLKYQEVGSLKKTFAPIYLPSKFHQDASCGQFFFSDGIKNDNCPDSIDMEDLFYMAGLFIGDGHCGVYSKTVKNKTGKSRQEFLNQRDGYGRFTGCEERGSQETSICHKYDNGFCLPEGDPARSKLISLLDKYGIKHCLTPVRVNVSSKRLVSFFRQFGDGAKNKTIPRWILDSSSNLLQKLFLGLIHSDGNHKAFANGKGVELTTVSDTIIPKLMELALKINHGFTYKKVHNKSLIDGGLADGDCYRVSFATTNKQIRKDKIETKKYTGKVWCLEVKDNHNFFIVRNGRLNVFGNCSVYGVNNDLIDETAEPKPLSAYATTKLAAEQYIVENCKNYLIFRLGTLYGLGDDHSRLRLDLVVNILTKKAVEGETLCVFGGQQWRPLLHVKDVGNAFEYGLRKDINGLYNLSEKNFNISDIADEIVKIVPGSSVEYKDMKFEDLRNYRVVNSKILDTGWTPSYQIADGIKELKEVFEEQRIKDPNDPVYSNAAYIKRLYS